MRKLEAAQWYSYMFAGDMTNFQSYYEKWKQWFDGNKLDAKYLATTTSCPDFIPVYDLEGKLVDYKINKEKGNNPMYIDECVPVSWASTANIPSKKSKETNAGAMAINVTTAAPEPVEVDQRKFLERRAYDAWYAQKEKLIELFFINEPDGPKTAKELKERLSKGLYTITIPKDEDDEEFDEDFRCFYWRDSFSWRTKDTKPDKAGFKAALEELNKFHRNVLDTIVIASPADGLIALKSLQDWKPAKK